VKFQSLFRIPHVVLEGSILLEFHQGLNDHPAKHMPSETNMLYRVFDLGAPFHSYQSQQHNKLNSNSCVRSLHRITLHFSYHSPVHYEPPKFYIPHNLTQNVSQKVAFLLMRVNLCRQPNESITSLF